MDLSIIIAHYNPANYSDCLQSFHKTLAEISAQKKKYTIEIIIADDGSVSNKGLIHKKTSKLIESGKEIYSLTNGELEKWKGKWSRNIHIPRWRKVCWRMEGWDKEWSRNDDFP